MSKDNLEEHSRDAVLPSEIRRISGYLFACGAQGRRYAIKLDTFLNGMVEDQHESDLLRERMSRLLTGTANALKGDPPELTSWSWHNLPELVADMQAEQSRLRGVVEAVEALAPKWRAWDDDLHNDTSTFQRGKAAAFRACARDLAAVLAPVSSSGEAETFADELDAHIAESMSDPEFRREAMAAAIYGGGDEAEWITTVDGSPCAAAYEYADRVLALPTPSPVPSGESTRSVADVVRSHALAARHVHHNEGAADELFEAAYRVQVLEAEEAARKQEAQEEHTWVCDGCMKTVTREQIAEWADFEHVLCRSCSRLRMAKPDQVLAPNEPTVRETLGRLNPVLSADLVLTLQDENDRLRADRAALRDEVAPLRSTAEWLVSLDNPDPDSVGFRSRRTVTLTHIIERARAALAPVPSGEAESGGRARPGAPARSAERLRKTGCDSSATCEHMEASNELRGDHH